MVFNHLQIEYLRLTSINNYHRQFRTPSKKQLEKVQRVIRECAYFPPIPIDGNNNVVTGEHFVEAARKMRLQEIPVILLDHLTEEQIRILRIAYDRIAEEAEWNKAVLAEEFRELQLLIPDIDLTLTGFEPPEIDILLNLSLTDPDEDIPALASGPSVIQPGDIYLLGVHRLYCGDALSPVSYEALMVNEKAQVCFTDFPYNVKIGGHVGNSGKIQHREFLMASGEMSDDEFAQFLYTGHKNIAAWSQDGAIIFSCMDWRGLLSILTAGAKAGLNLLNLAVWVKDNGGMGSLYRSRHELVPVFKNGTGKHINNVELGKHGRYRTNVWEYPGVNSFGSGRMDDLALHPTVKPLEMVMDALKDCSNRGGIVLDPFGGSGTTLIAAEKTGRKARLIELDPLYCDVIVRRWQTLTGKDAIHAASGKTFNEIAAAGGKDA